MRGPDVAVEVSAAAVSRVLLTGGTGFVGLHLAKALSAAGHQVHAVVRPSAASDRRAALATVAVLHEVERPAEIRDAVDACAPLACFHMAAHATSAHGARDVDLMLSANVALGTHLADALAGTGARLVHARTFWQHYEGSSYAPTSLYAATKQAYDDVLRHYVDRDLLAVTPVTLFDTYGPEDPRGKLVDLLLAAALTGEPLQVSPGGQMLDLVHVDDVARALVLAADAPPWTAGKPVQEAAYTAGTGQLRTMREVTAIVEQVIGRSVPVEWGARPYRDREMMEPWVSPRPVPGWAPNVSLSAGVQDLWQRLRHR